MYLLKKELKRSSYLRQLASPAIAARRKWLRFKLAPKVEVYEHLCEILLNDPIIRLDEFNGDFLINRHSTLLRRILIHGYYEPELAECCTRYIDTQRDIVDIGANVGFYSVFFAQKISDSRKVLAVEPTDDAFARLTKNLKMNGVDGKVLTYKGVASDSIGELNLSVVQGKEEYSSIGSMEHPSISQEEHISVQVRSSTLDELVEVNDIDPGFVKIDVEGAEDLTLRGAKKTLTNHRPVILSEISNLLLESNGSSAKEVVNFIRSHNYKVLNPLFPEEELEKNPYGDILCVPQ